MGTSIYMPGRERGVVHLLSWRSDRGWSRGPDWTRTAWDLEEKKSRAAYKSTAYRSSAAYKSRAAGKCGAASKCSAASNSVRQAVLCSKQFFAAYKSSAAYKSAGSSYDLKTSNYELSWESIYLKHEDFSSENLVKTLSLSRGGYKCWHPGSSYHHC